MIQRCKQQSVWDGSFSWCECYSWSILLCWLIPEAVPPGKNCRNGFHRREEYQLWMRWLWFLMLLCKEKVTPTYLIWLTKSRWQKHSSTVQLGKAVRLLGSLIEIQVRGDLLDQALHKCSYISKTQLWDRWQFTQTASLGHNVQLADIGEVSLSARKRIIFSSARVYFLLLVEEPCWPS